MKKVIVFILFGVNLFGQQNDIFPLEEMLFNEYLGYVKKFHPLVKNANLEIDIAQAKLMIARGGFDPRLEVDFDKKEFQEKEYYSQLNSSFKIPTWYGIDVKAGFENNEGYFLNPENTTPLNGLPSLGINVPVGQGFLINQRMADLKKAKLQVKMSQAERKLEAIEVLHNAALAYFEWKKSHEEFELYELYNKNATIRYNAVVSLIKNGDKPAIDSIEAGITVKSRLLNLEDSKLKRTKARLELSNFLWLENNLPVELSENINPEKNLQETIQETLKTNELLNVNFDINDHPKIEVLENKLGMLNVDKKMMGNKLLPRIDLEYSYLSQPNQINEFNNQLDENYKVGLNFYFPLFLRKERGYFKIAKYKIQESNAILDVEKIQLSNKINAQKVVIQSLDKQKKIVSNLVNDYQNMLQSEERLFSFGESSLFLINTRENNLISSKLSQISLDNRFYISNSELFKIMANPD